MAATITHAHTPSAFPFRQLQCRVGEQVNVVERFDTGWWEVRKADGAEGRVPENKLVEHLKPGQKNLSRSLSRSLSRRSVTVPSSRRVPVAGRGGGGVGRGGGGGRAPPALPEGRAGSPRRDLEPPAGLTMMQRIKWKEEHAKPTGAAPAAAAARAGYGGDAALAGDVHLEPAAEPPPSCLSQAGNIVDMELQRVAYSVWSKYLTAFAALFLLLMSICVVVMEIEEERYMRNTIRSSSEGELTSFHQLGALLSGAAALLLFVNERFWGVFPWRKEEKEGTLWVRVILLALTLVLRKYTSNPHHSFDFLGLL